MKENGNFRSSALFYNYYNIYNIVANLISTTYNGVKTLRQRATLDQGGQLCLHNYVN